MGIAQSEITGLPGTFSSLLLILGKRYNLLKLVTFCAHTNNAEVLSHVFYLPFSNS